MFETNLRDERYLPFEGAGVISAWSLALLGKPRSFDYDTIADVLLTIRYTARPDENRTDAEKSAAQWLKTHAARVFSMRHEFSTGWAAFKRPRSEGEGPRSVEILTYARSVPFPDGEGHGEAEALAPVILRQCRWRCRPAEKRHLTGKDRLGERDDLRVERAAGERRL